MLCCNTGRSDFCFSVIVPVFDSWLGQDLSIYFSTKNNLVQNSKKRSQKKTQHVFLGNQGGRVVFADVIVDSKECSTSAVLVVHGPNALPALLCTVIASNQNMSLQIHLVPEATNMLDFSTMQNIKIDFTAIMSKEKLL